MLAPTGCKAAVVEALRFLVTIGSLLLLCTSYRTVASPLLNFSDADNARIDLKRSLSMGLSALLPRVEFVNRLQEIFSSLEHGLLVLDRLYDAAQLTGKGRDAIAVHRGDGHNRPIRLSLQECYCCIRASYVHFVCGNNSRLGCKPRPISLQLVKQRVKGFADERGAIFAAARPNAGARREREKSMRKVKHFLGQSAKKSVRKSDSQEGREYGSKEDRQEVIRNSGSQAVRESRRDEVKKSGCRPARQSRSTGCSKRPAPGTRSGSAPPCVHNK